MKKEKNRFNIEEHTTLDNKIIDVFPTSHRYIHRLETQLKKQQEIIDRTLAHLNIFISDEQLSKYDTLKILMYAKKILEDKEV